MQEKAGRLQANQNMLG